jgi:N-acetyl-alpha-D-muramate 1-phosphate uridylyltransferase
MTCTAMILAAGRGERMRPLTDLCPKPLLQVRGKPLMQWPLEALARAGVSDVMVNTAWLGAQIPACFGDRFAPVAASSGGVATSATDAVALRLHYSHEGRDFGAALETAGGIVRVLPQLADPFWVLAGDVFAPDFEFSVAALNDFRASGKLAQIWLVPNPPHHPAGDFGLTDEGMATDGGTSRLTYSTVGLYRHAFFAPPYCDIAVGNPQGVQAPLAPMLRLAIGHGLVSARRYTGRWVDVGTPQRLAQLNQVSDS